MRSNHGKGVTYARINGRGVVFITTPGFFLHALDAKTGKPLEGWGGAVPVAGFPKTGSVDLLKDLIADWIPWRQTEAEIRPGQGAAARARLHHDVVAAHRRQRRARRRQFRRAGLQPDARRECPGRHPGVRRKDRKVHVEVPRDSAAGRVRPRDVGKRRVAVDGRCLVVGADVSRPGARARLHPHQRRHDRLLRRVPARRQPVQHQRPRARRQDRQTRLAPAAREARHLELRHADRARCCSTSTSAADGCRGCSR